MNLRLHKLDVELVSSANSLSIVYLMLMRIQIFYGIFMLQNSPDMNLLCENLAICCGAHSVPSFLLLMFLRAVSRV